VPGLTIGVNALYLIPGHVGGTEIYFWNLLKALAATDETNEYFVYVNAETASESYPVSSPRVHFLATGIRASNRPWRVAWEQTAFPLRLKKDQIDVLLNPGFTGPFLWGRPSVTVFHDLQHKRHPEFFRWFDLPFWNLLLRMSVERSQTLIAVSQATANDLAHFYPHAAVRIKVIRHGVDPQFFRIGEKRRYAGLQENKYLLTVSTLHPHKNLERLMRAFVGFREEHPEFRLVIAGLSGFAYDQLVSVRRELGLQDLVTFTGWIPREQLYALYEQATAFLAPSLFEGYGMPLIEALAAGIPTACSDIPVFNEIAGAAVIRFDPRQVQDIGQAMEQVACSASVRARAAIAGPDQARKVDWRMTADLTRRAIENAVRTPHTT
jgi:glycosyltransferase involved in cell wall biosynthesis